MNLIRVHILQMDTEHLGYISADKITSVHAITMTQPAPDSTEEDPKVITKEVTVVNIQGQQPVFVRESPRLIASQARKGA